MQRDFGPGECSWRTSTQFLHTSRVAVMALSKSTTALGSQQSSQLAALRHAGRFREALLCDAVSAPGSVGVSGVAMCAVRAVRSVVLS